MRSIRHILHPTDFSKGAEPAAELALEMALKFGADLTLIHVYSIQVYIGAFGEGYALSPGVIEKLQDDAEKALEKLRQRAEAAGVRTQTLAIEGIPAEAILALADARDMDLIVMGTHGRSGFRHLLLGSVAERIVRSARCPVLTVRSEMERKPA